MTAHSGAAANATPKVSVVIPTYNRSGLLEKTLHQLESQRMPAGEFEVIVADDGSSDTTEAVTKSFSDRLRVKYTFQEDLGFRAGAARNLGARLADAPLLTFLDTGTLPGPGFLPSHLSEHDGGPGHAVVIGYTHGWTGAPDAPPLPGVEDALLRLPLEEVVALFGGRNGFHDVRHPVLLEYGFDLGCHLIPWPMLLSNNFSVPAADFWAAGGFDEELHGWGFEDIELGYRLFQHGQSFTMSQDAWAVEWPHPRATEEQERQQATVNMARFLRKHPEPSAEIMWWALHNADMWLCERYYRELRAWSEQARDMDVAAELADAARHVSPGERVGIIGSGAVVPASLAGATVMDFDRQLLDRAEAVGQGHHTIGLRTPLPDQSVDTVLITSRLAGVWPRWGEAILTEARRIGRQVRALGQVGQMQ
jgi:GT2 family glycosyltransferase